MLTSFQLYTGLVSSAALLILAVMFVRRMQHSHTNLGVDTSGVLQVAWLFGGEPRLSKVEEPDLEVLRVAGMYRIDPEELRLRRAGASKTKEKGDEEQYLYQADTQDAKNFTSWE